MCGWFFYHLNNKVVNLLLDRKAASASQQASNSTGAVPKSGVVSTTSGSQPVTSGSTSKTVFSQVVFWSFLKLNIFMVS
jgi:hypothetical protein